MESLNKAMIIGNLGADPEMRFTPNGTPVTSLRVAVSRRYRTSSGEQKQETEWFNVVTWNRLAENCNQMLTKGQQVYVEGRVRTRSWEGQGGEPRFHSEVVANRVLFLTRRRPSAMSREEVEGNDELPYSSGKSHDSGLTKP